MIVTTSHRQCIHEYTFPDSLNSTRSVTNQNKTTSSTYIICQYAYSVHSSLPPPGGDATIHSYLQNMYSVLHLYFCYLWYALRNTHIFQVHRVYIFPEYTYTTQRKTSNINKVASAITTGISCTCRVCALCIRMFLAM